ncbi:MAG: hypothetical protein WC755_07930 [Candidatus Woesearchaeota archaeon]|jgi:hypothetical protein
MKFPTQESLKKYPHKVVDGKKVYFMSKKNLPPIGLLKNVYGGIKDNRKIPVVFETKKQYLQDYIKNQEKIKKYDFPKKQEQQYIKTELKDMKNIVSRYTTKNNKYIEPRIVFFTDNKVGKQGYKQNIYHEFGHEMWERSPTLRKKWSSKTSPTSSPTMYGKTDKEEDFCESYAVTKTGFTVDKNRETILKDVTSHSRYNVGQNVRANIDMRIDTSKKGISYVPENTKGRVMFVRENTPENIVVQFEGHPLAVNVNPAEIKQDRPLPKLNIPLHTFFKDKLQKFYK